MCGSKLEPVVIDDRDPLGLEAPAYWSGDRAQSAQQEPAQLRERDRQRELVRESAIRGSSAGRSILPSSTAVESFPPGTAEEEAHALPRHKEPAPRTTSGIAGPSFLGLGYENASDRGFVYDKPRNDGFVYDTDTEAPEYLLEEVPRGISWRAWALFALLLVGAGLGYVQWRASHNQGPDIAAILAGNGATVDPGGPVMTGNNGKPAATKPEAPAAAASTTTSEHDDEAQAGSSDKSGASTSEAMEASDSNTASAQVAKKDDSSDSKTADDSENASASSSPAKDSDESAKPESDGPLPRTANQRPAKLAPVEATTAPKPLGDKDPLIVEAERYIQGRGVRQNCSTGINLLHQAMSAGNPAAEVKMGALYWSGTCVTQSNVTAYQWFSRAHALEPQNRWIERSRNSLWASMSSDEKRRVSY